MQYGQNAEMERGRSKQPWAASRSDRYTGNPRNIRKEIMLIIHNRLAWVKTKKKHL